jgi:hypothetical protein
MDGRSYNKNNDNKISVISLELTTTSYECDMDARINIPVAAVQSKTISPGEVEL